MTGFPQDPSKLEVGIAFGADLSADPTTPTYTTVTSTVQPEILITRGRIADSTITQPSTVDLTMLNPNGLFSPRNITGPHYGQLRRNTPMRVRVDTGSGFVTRGFGYIPDWSPRWIGPNMGDKIQLQAAGVMRRLGQGQDPRSALRRTILGKNNAAPVLYWPFEDAAMATQVVSGLLGGAALTNVVGITPAAIDTCVGSEPYATLTAIQPGTATQGAPAALVDLTQFNMSSNRISIGLVLSAFFAPTPAPTDIAVATVTTSTGALVQFTVLAGYSGGARTNTFGLTVTGYNILGEVFDPFDGNSHSVLVTWTQNGGNVDVTLVLDGVTYTSTTAQTLGVPQMLTLGVASVGTLDGLAMNSNGARVGIGHLTVWSDVTPTDPHQASIGYVGEQAAVRFARLCAEEGILSDIAS